VCGQNYISQIKVKHEKPYIKSVFLKSNLLMLPLKRWKGGW